MSEKKVSTAEFVRHFGRYHDEAMREPITLTRHGRASVVVVPAEFYNRMTKNAGDPRKVYTTSETPPDMAEMLLSEIDDYLASTPDESA
ncbi:type II toxin-antitoxin system prevent-host-death family antitoxin [Brucella pseudogrignonensis]|jgi:prevent-host-death family protein|uniref:Antitoxin n=1 Tax=Brucella pseudogrignonensis TaxID=419475 RepID=A0ABU1MF57_9HYPH|nr:type II toxin-antitoxin system prevent-host-death family antitoxin [Brucella pseudogrignonensis]MDR6434685.1 prevent-host-death family protein [Brucella pseudogrignonensis]